MAQFTELFKTQFLLHVIEKMTTESVKHAVPKGEASYHFCYNFLRIACFVFVPQCISIRQRKPNESESDCSLLKSEKRAKLKHAF